MGPLRSLFGIFKNNNTQVPAPQKQKADAGGHTWTKKLSSPFISLFKLFSPSKKNQSPNTPASPANVVIIRRTEKGKEKVTLTESDTSSSEDSEVRNLGEKVDDLLRGGLEGEPIGDEDTASEGDTVLNSSSLYTSTLYSSNFLSRFDRKELIGVSYALREILTSQIAHNNAIRMQAEILNKMVTDSKFLAKLSKDDREAIKNWSEQLNLYLEKSEIANDELQKLFEDIRQEIELNPPNNTDPKKLNTLLKDLEKYYQSDTFNEMVEIQDQLFLEASKMLAFQARNIDKISSFMDREFTRGSSPYTYSPEAPALQRPGRNKMLMEAVHSRLNSSNPVSGAIVANLAERVNKINNLKRDFEIAQFREQHPLPKLEELLKGKSRAAKEVFQNFAKDRYALINIAEAIMDFDAKTADKMYKVVADSFLIETAQKMAVIDSRITIANLRKQLKNKSQSEANSIIINDLKRLRFYATHFPDLIRMKDVESLEKLFLNATK